MPSTYAQAVTTWKNRTLMLNEHELYANSASNNIAGMIDTLRDAQKGDRWQTIMAKAEQDRAAIAGLITDSRIREVLAPHLVEILEASDVDINPRDFAYNLERVRKYMIDNSLSMNSREMTFGSPSAGGGNTGNGNFYRLTEDQDGYDYEGASVETKLWRCVADQRMGDDGLTADEQREIWRLEADPPGVDAVNDLGSGATVDMATVDPSTGEDLGIVINPTFQTTGTEPTSGQQAPSTTTEITGWIMGSTASIELDADRVYRGLPDQENRYSIRFTGNTTLKQTIRVTDTSTEAGDSRYVFQSGIPIYREFAIYKPSGTTGNVIFRFGAITITTVLGSLSNDQWTVIKCAQDQNCFPKNFNEDAMTIEFETTSLSGNCNIADLTVSPYTYDGDGSWVVCSGGTTPWKYDDTFSYSDSEGGSRGVMSYWWNHRSRVSRFLGRAFTFPTVASGETITDPS